MYADQIHHDGNVRYDRDITISGEAVCNIVVKILIKSISESQMTVKQTPARPYQGLVLLDEAQPSADTFEEKPDKKRTQVYSLLLDIHEAVLADI